jgi:aldose 1-epimerase
VVATHRLLRGDLAVEVSLQGGGIQRFARGGQTLMCPAPTAPHLACFAMLPFCSRINNGRFQYGEHQVALTPNFPPEPHAIHGFGWQGLWQLETQSDEACVLVYEHDGAASDDTGWPWTFRASQHVVLLENGLSVTLALENLSHDVMPAGMGLHPHYPFAAGMHVSMACADRVVMTDDSLPMLAKLGDHGEVNPLADRPWLRRGLDDVFAHRIGGAQVVWPDQPWSLSIEPDPMLAHWIVYAPRDSAFICIEPISHLPNAVNLNPLKPPFAGEMKALKPGQSWTTTTSFMTLATVQSTLQASPTS